MRFDVITIFPQIFNSYFSESIIRRAQEKKLIKLRVHDLRDFTIDKRRTVDDKPYGGGPGMILKIEPISKAIAALRAPKGRGGEKKAAVKNLKPKRRVILFSAKGKTVTQADIRRLAKYDQLILICGRYEGVDERVAKYIADEEISVGNYVLTGGEIPAMIMVDAVSRLIPGVLGKKESLEEESFGGKGIRKRKLGAGNYLEYPQYTRPEEFKDRKVPRVLLSGDHKKIKDWRERMSKN